MARTRKRPTQADIDRLAGEWWKTATPGAPARFVRDDEIEAVDRMMETVDEFPEWAIQVRDAMPRYGFEMCAHRWLDGLDNCLRMLAEGRPRPSDAGHCGDVPGWVAAEAEARAAAVQAWLDAETPPGPGVGRQVAEWLGDPTPEKTEAATCFVEMLRSHLFGADDEANAATAKWQARAAANPVIKELFEAEGLAGILQNGCGYRTVRCLDLMIRAIGGDADAALEARGLCNQQLRFVFRDDPARYDTTRGYLWGLEAYLSGHDEAWLRREKPDCAGAAIYALRAARRAGESTALRRWLAASLLKAMKVWCRCAIDRAGPANVPAPARDLPDVLVALGAE